MTEGAEIRASINARGFFEFPGDLLKELPQQKDSQGVGDPGNDEGLVRIHPPERPDLQVQRNGQHLKRNDHRTEEDGKQHAPSRELQPGERISRQRIHDQAQRCHGECYEDAVENVPRKWERHQREKLTV